MMIPDLDNYFRGFVPARDNLLQELEEEARREQIPIVGPVVGELLYILASATQAQNILELGTATGYSTLYLARACEARQGRVITVEWSESLAARARANFVRAGVDGLVEIRVGGAQEVLAGLSGPFDLLFMDIDKEGYLPALDQCQRLLKKNGLLVTDNVGFRGAADFNQAIFNRSQWRVVPLLCLLPQHSPEKDGLSLALRV